MDGHISLELVMHGLHAQACSLLPYVFCRAGQVCATKHAADLQALSKGKVQCLFWAAVAGMPKSKLACAYTVCASSHGIAGCLLGACRVNTADCVAGLIVRLTGNGQALHWSCLIMLDKIYSAAAGTMIQLTLMRHEIWKIWQIAC